MKNEILKSIFWDLDTEKLDIRKNFHQIIEVVKKSRQLSKKSANFWANYYKIPKEEVRCLNKRFLAIHRSIWPY